MMTHARAARLARTSQARLAVPAAASGRAASLPGAAAATTVNLAIMAMLAAAALLAAIVPEDRAERVKHLGGVEQLVLDYVDAL
jgi:hypothetical protein